MSNHDSLQGRETRDLVRELQIQGLEGRTTKEVKAGLSHVTRSGSLGTRLQEANAKDRVDGVRIRLRSLPPRHRAQGSRDDTGAEALLHREHAEAVFPGPAHRRHRRQGDYRLGNYLLECRTSKGKPYSATYLNTLCSQLSAIMNHLVRFYGLERNPVQIAGKVGSKERREMDVWTKEEYLRFSDAIADKPYSHLAFEILFWCGLRVGEMLALTPADIDFEASQIKVSKSVARIGGEDILTPPPGDSSVVQDGHHACFSRRGAQRVPDDARDIEPEREDIPEHDQAPPPPRDDEGR